MADPTRKRAGRRVQIWLIAVVVSLSGGAVAACTRSAFRTVPGPESGGVIRDARGYVLVNVSPAGIQAFELPGLAGTTTRPRPRGYASAVHAIGGPDRRGRVAFVENHMTAEFHILKTIQLDGSDERQVVEREGDALWTFKGHGVWRVLVEHKMVWRDDLAAKSAPVRCPPLNGDAIERFGYSQ